MYLYCGCVRRYSKLRFNPNNLLLLCFCQQTTVRGGMVLCLSLRFSTPIILCTTEIVYNEKYVGSGSESIKKLVLSESVAVNNISVYVLNRLLPKKCMSETRSGRNHGSCTGVKVLKPGLKEGGMSHTHTPL